MGGEAKDGRDAGLGKYNHNHDERGRFSTAEDAVAPEGNTRGRDLGAAGGGHHDPTTDPHVWEAFQHRVETAYAQAMPDSWKPDLLPEPVPAAPTGWTPSQGQRHDFQPPSLEWVQASLNRLGIPHVPLIVDGIEGRATRAAIVDFQQAHKLWIDGDVGPDTVAAIEKALA